MTGKERFVTALKGGKPDRVPIFDFLDSQIFIERITGRRPEAYNARDVMEATLSYGLDGAFIGYGGFGGFDTTEEREIDENHYRDEWGTVFKKTDYSWPTDAPVDFPIKGRSDLKKYKLPDPELPSRLAEISTAQQMGGEAAAIIGGVQGPLTTAMLLCGLENIFSWAYDDPDLVVEIFNLSNEYYKVAIKKLIEAKIDVICIPEDLGFASAPFFGPEQFRKLLLPYIAELFALAAAGGVPTFLHCDGNINLYLDDLFSMGINGLHPIQRTAGMCIKEVREKFGGKLCLIGNVDSSHLLVNGTDNEIIRQTLEVIRDAGKDGALILASDSDLRNEMPFEKVDLMFKTALKYGGYPLDVEALENGIEEALIANTPGSSL